MHRHGRELGTLVTAQYYYVLDSPRNMYYQAILKRPRIV